MSEKSAPLSPSGMTEKQKIAAAERCRRPRPWIIEAWRSGTCAQHFPGRKRVHFVRHGQGEHNKLKDEIGRIAYQDPRVLDARLTQLGKQQAEALQPLVEGLEVELVVVSPLSRAVETAQIGFRAHKCPFVANELCREQCGGSHICDKRRTTAELKADFPQIDFADLATNEDALHGNERELLTSIADRAFKFIMWLRRRPESNIAVVCHSQFLVMLFNSVLQTSNPKLKSWFSVGEARSVDLLFFAAPGQGAGGAVSRLQQCLLRQLVELQATNAELKRQQQLLS